MTRPKDPTFTVPSVTIPVFAPNANYPISADPWSGTPTKVAHPGAASVGLTPKTGVAAQVLNKLVNDAYATDSSIQTALATTVSEAQTFCTSLADHNGQMRPQNFRASINLAAASALVDFCWNEAAQAWYVFGPTDQGFYSVDGGFTWNAQAPGAAGLLTIMRCAAHPSNGSMVVVAASTTVYENNGSAWATHTGALPFTPAFTIAYAHLKYDPIHSKWVLVCKNSASTTTGVATSSDRVTWTSQTPSAGMTVATIAATGCDVNKISGRILTATANAASSPTNFKISKSDDGGTTWTDLATITPGITAAGGSTFTPLFCDPSNGRWYFCVTSISASKNFEIWMSTDDGATWTRQCQKLGFYTPNCMAGDGAELVIYTDTSEIIYSVDYGVTWRRAGYKSGVSVSANSLRCNGRQYVLAFNNSLAVSIKGGLDPSF